MPTGILIGYLFCRFVNKKVMLFRRPPFIRFVMYGMVAPLVTFIAVFLEDVNKYNIEGTLDNRTCNLGISYAKGGVEYYDKQLKRHIALRSLMPQNRAKNIYNIQGDLWPSFTRGYKYRPITQRKQHCMKILNHFQNNV